MITYQLVIAPAAKDDLKDIYQYGLSRWGQLQSDNYLENLKSQLWLLTEQPLLGVERPDLFPSIRSLPIESHILFYSMNGNKIEVIRVLHGRQDPKKQLK